MRLAKNPKIGEVVYIPSHQFAPWRNGWNGWLFNKGIVVAIGKSKNDGSKIYKVEYPCMEYNATDCKITITKWFNRKAVFETDLWNQNRVMQHPREAYGSGCWGADTEFLIDKGIVKE